MDNNINIVEKSPKRISLVTKIALAILAIIDVLLIIMAINDKTYVVLGLILIINFWPVIFGIPIIFAHYKTYYNWQPKGKFAKYCYNAIGYFCKSPLHVFGISIIILYGAVFINACFKYFLNWI